MHMLQNRPRALRIDLGRRALLCLALGSSLMAASSSQTYVDAVNGNDSNDGQTPATAFKSITGALAPTGTGNLRVFPGRYDTANGEIFPLQLSPATFIVGTDFTDESPVIIDAGNRPLAIRMRGGAPQFPGFLGGAIIENAGVGMSCSGSGGESGQNGAVFLVRLTFRNCGVGLAVDSANGGAYVDGVLVSFEDCGVGLRLDQASAVLFNSSFQRCAGAAMAVIAGPFGSTFVDVFDCTINDCGTGVFSSTQNGSAALNVTGLGISNCARGIELRQNIGSTSNGGLSADFRHLTVAGCQEGILAPTDPSSVVTISRSIVSGNGVDLPLGGGSIQFASTIAPLLGGVSPGILAVEPSLTDVPGGDLTPRAGSLALDRLNVVTNRIAYDGDFDAVSLADMGAVERRTLRRTDGLDGPVPAGTSVEFTVDLPDAVGGFALLTREFAALNPGPATPFGDLWLNRPSLERLAPITAGAAAGEGRFTLVTPADSGLIGTTWSVQALVPSAGAGLGFAFTSPAEILFE